MWKEQFRLPVSLLFFVYRRINGSTETATEIQHTVAARHRQSTNGTHTMRKLVIPDALKDEFATVEVLWYSNAETKRVDSLALSWIKYEKQLRRLFTFFIYQHP